MTEVEWLTCTNPTRIWGYLYDKGSLRQLQLAACACCRHIWPLLTEKYQHLVELSEQAADGLVTDEQLNEAWDSGDEDLWIWNAAARAAVSATGLMAAIRGELAFEAASGYAVIAATGGDGRYDDNYDPTIPAVAAELESLARLLRCITGNPFRAVEFDPARLTWNDGVIPKLAKAIYEERAFERMPILADALEEAGYSHIAILTHCRQPGEHARGCWVVDLILGKS